jgi:carbon storage regulator
VLVLTRRAGESIVIGDDVRVVVLDVRGDTVRLGIEAPRSVQVHRAEVYAEVQAANAAAASRIDDLGGMASSLQRLARPRPGASSGVRVGRRGAGGASGRGRGPQDSASSTPASAPETPVADPSATGSPVAAPSATGSPARPGTPAPTPVPRPHPRPVPKPGPPAAALAVPGAAPVPKPPPAGRPAVPAPPVGSTTVPRLVTPEPTADSQQPPAEQRDQPDTPEQAGQ